MPSACRLPERLAQSERVRLPSVPFQATKASSQVDHDQTVSDSEQIVQDNGGIEKPPLVRSFMAGKTIVSINFKPGRTADDACWE
jgi:hypothetical protein